jgi:uncharacterized membrane protein
MFEQQMMKVATGLALIIPLIFILKWFLGRKVGSPEQWAEEQIEELKRRYARGEMDEETYQRRLEDLTRH